MSESAYLLQHSPMPNISPQAYFSIIYSKGNNQNMKFSAIIVCVLIKDARPSMFLSAFASVCVSLFVH